MIQVEQMVRDFPDGDGKTIRALSVVHFELADGAACAIIGPSGSGKSTFLHCLAGLLTPTAGTISINGTVLPELTEEKAAQWRAAHVGYIFQQSLLLPYLTVMENILLSASLSGKDDKEEEAEKLLETVNLKGCGRRRPEHLSGGERQRVSFVRAIISDPDLILADEPTASLDQTNSKILMDLLLEYQKKRGCTLICATHDPAVQALFYTKYYMNRGGAL